MWEFLSANAPIINTISNVAMVIIWLVYLQVFLNTYLRQRRSVLHIDRGIAKDEHARCIVTNLGQEPIYLLAIVVDFGTDGGTSRAVVTDRDEIGADQASRPMERTNQGPLASGEPRDVGSLADLMERARHRLELDMPLRDIRAMWVSAVAISQQGSHIMAANKGFEADHSGGGAPAFTPMSVLTKQVRAPWRQRRLMALLEDRQNV